MTDVITTELTVSQALWAIGVVGYLLLVGLHIGSWVQLRSGYTVEAKVGLLWALVITVCLLIVSHHLISEERYKQLSNQQKQIMTELQRQK